MAFSSQILPLYRLVTPTVSVTLAGATTSSNTTFNTNIPTGMYMNLRRISTMQAFKVTMVETAAVTNQFLYELTEDTTKTAVSQTDPFALVDGGLEEDFSYSTSAAFNTIVRDLLRDHDYMWPHPGVPTVAQQLNLVCTGSRIVGTSVQKVDTFLQLYYELLAIDERIRGFLTNRIVLQRTT